MRVLPLPDARIVYGCAGGSLWLWDAHSDGAPRRLAGHSSEITGLALLPDGRLISSGGDIRAQSLEGGAATQVLPTAGDSPRDLVLLPDGRLLMGGYQRLRTFSWPDPKVPGIPQRPMALHAASSPRAVAGRIPATEPERNAECVYVLAALPDGRVVSGSQDGAVRLWDPSDRVAPRQIGHAGTIPARGLQDHPASIGALAVLPDGRVVSGSDDFTVQIWDAAGGAAPRVLAGHRNSIRHLLVLEGGRIVSAANDGTLRVWNPASGASRELQGGSQSIAALAVLPDGRLVSGGLDDKVRIWDVTGSTPTRELQGHDATVWAVGVLPDGRVVSGGEDGTVRLWEPDGRQGSQVLERHPYEVRHLAVLPDGRVLSAGNDGSVRIHDPSGRTATLQVQWQHIEKLAMLPDGRAVVTDGTSVKVSSHDHHHLRQTFRPDTGIQCLCVASPVMIVAGGFDGTVHCLRLLPG